MVEPGFRASIYVKGRHKHTEAVIAGGMGFLHLLIHFLRYLQQPRLGQAEVRIQKCNLSLLHGYQGSRELSCHYCLPGFA